MSKKIATPGSFKRSEDVQLPSQQGTDEWVKLRKPDPSQLISSDGDTPDVLTNMIVEMLNAKEGDEEYVMEYDAQTLPALFGILERVCIVAFVEPLCWDRDYEDDEHFPVSYLSLADKQFVFEWAMGGEFSAASTFPNGKKQKA